MVGKKILVVDDDPDMRHGIDIRLRAHGYQTCFAVDALSGVAEARKHQPDLILLDLGLPAGDGFIVMERLHSHAELAQIPIIVVSARDVRGNQERALKAGAKAFLQKPADNAALLGVIRRLLGEPEQPGDAVTYEL